MCPSVQLFIWAIAMTSTKENVEPLVCDYARSSHEELRVAAPQDA